MNKRLPLLEKGTIGGIDFYRQTRDHSGPLLYTFLIAVVCFFFIIILRLFQLTVVKGTYYHNLADQNRIREIVIEPKRGTIIDRRGFIIAQNREAEIGSDSPRLISKRFYTDGETVAHVIGYRQTADRHDLDNDTCMTRLKLGDKVGKKGVEKLFDCDLRGVAGKKLIEVDAPGRSVNTIAVSPPQDGKTVQLALDFDLQKKAYDRIKDLKAAVVAFKPQTGEVLIMASSPSFQPQDFENNDGPKITAYFKDKDKPLFNRATEGTYPPGSTFKIVLAVAALEEKSIDAHTMVEDTGTIQAGTLKFGNWYYLEYGKTDGMVDVVKALKRSNDIFFYKISEKVGPEKIKKWSEQFGMNRKTGVGLDEASGNIPSPFWKEDALHEQWYLGDTYNFSIGQGYVLTTPIQIASFTNVLANGGYLCQPTLLKAQNGAGHCKKLPITPEVMHLIQEGMRQACATGGTGWPFFDFHIGGDPASSQSAALKTKQPRKDISVACKTGTAEAQGSSTKPYAWFTTYAPADNPEIVMTVLVEEGGQGSDAAAPIAKDILSMYFERTQ